MKKWGACEKNNSNELDLWYVFANCLLKQALSKVRWENSGYVLMRHRWCSKKMPRYGRASSEAGALHRLCKGDENGQHHGGPSQGQSGGASHSRCHIHPLHWAWRRFSRANLLPEWDAEGWDLFLRGARITAFTGPSAAHQRRPLPYRRSGGRGEKSSLYTEYDQPKVSWWSLCEGASGWTAFESSKSSGLAETAGFFPWIK